MRRWNPLGLKVVNFRPEPEVLNESPDRNERVCAMRWLLIALSALCVLDSGVAEQLPVKGAVDSRIRVAAYRRRAGLSSLRLCRLSDRS